MSRPLATVDPPTPVVAAGAAASNTQPLPVLSAYGFSAPIHEEKPWSGDVSVYKVERSKLPPALSRASSGSISLALPPTVTGSGGSAGVSFSVRPSVSRMLSTGSGAGSGNTSPSAGSGSALVPLEVKDYGVLESECGYVIMYTYTQRTQTRRVIYFWNGTLVWVLFYF
jgi:hypothetical protein